MDLGNQGLDMQFGMNNRKPFVAVWMVTFNHELYIGQAIESVLMQETDFEFHLFIGEDCSTDRTSDICKKFAEKHPDKITLYAQKENVGATNNAFIIYNACFESGAKYVAMLEGDDYWTDPYKLQKQVDFLEANPDYSFCFHDSTIMKYNGEIKVRIDDKIIDTIVDLKSLIKEKNITTASIVFRNIINFLEVPEWFYKIKQGDYGLLLLLTEKGLGKYIPENMCTYRVHEGGVWSSKGRLNVGINDEIFFNYLFRYFESSEIKKEIEIKLRSTYKTLAIDYAKISSINKSVMYFLKSLPNSNQKIKESLHYLRVLTLYLIRNLLKPQHLKN